MADLPKSPGTILGERLLKLDRAADILQMSRRWVADAIKRGDLPVIRCGRSVRIDIRDIDNFINARKSPRSSEAPASRGAAR